MFFIKSKFMLPLLLALGLICAGQVHAAEQAKPVATAGNLIKTKNFEVSIPAGWVMPKEPRSSKRASAAIFSNNKAQIAVELSVLDSTKTAKEMANITAKDMRSHKLVVSDPEESANGFYVMDVDGGPLPYRCWVGANGKVATITTILGTNIAAANELLKAVKPAQAGMFPTSVK